MLLYNTSSKLRIFSTPVTHNRGLSFCLGCKGASLAIDTEAPWAGWCCQLDVLFLGVKGWAEKVITRWKDDWNDAYHSNFIICHCNLGRVVFALYGLIRFRAPTWFLLVLCWSTTYGSHSSWSSIVSWSFIWFSLQNQSKPCSSNQSNVMRKSTDCHRICLIVA